MQATTIYSNLIYNIPNQNSQVKLIQDKLNECVNMGCFLREYINTSEYDNSVDLDTLNVGKDSISPATLDKNSVTVHTVDSFQGSECDIVILSCVRSNESAKLGFVNDFRRLNVAITRAKYSLITIANVDTLCNAGKHIKINHT